MKSDKKEFIIGLNIPTINCIELTSFKVINKYCSIPHNNFRHKNHSKILDATITAMK